MAHKFFKTEQFNFEFQLALGGVWYGCGDVGELLSTASRITDGDADSWCEQWTATADRLAAVADDCAAGGHRVSARAAYLRASAYCALALSAVDGTSDPSGLLLPTFRAHRRCFDAYIAQLGDTVRWPLTSEGASWRVRLRSELITMCECSSSSGRLGRILGSPCAGRWSALTRRG